eukprot:CCRYP_001363-RA/>CCRYP_001363-RA protein AED:0.73 eAED:0.35 QI:0/-1/0/1/-1/0/1/0/238
MISNLVNKTWFSRYPRCQYIIYHNGSGFKLHFNALCDSYGITSTPTCVKNPLANAILERVHQVISSMLRTAKIDMAPSVESSNIDKFVKNIAWAIRSRHHTVLKASPGAAIFGRDMLFNTPFLADWNKIGEYRQHQTDQNTERENCSHRDWDYKVGDQALLRKDGILCKGESDMKVILGLSHQFIRMATSGLNMEQNRKDRIYKDAPFFNNQKRPKTDSPFSNNTYSLHMFNKLFSWL